MSHKKEELESNLFRFVHEMKKKVVTQVQAPIVSAILAEPLYLKPVTCVP